MEVGNGGGCRHIDWHAAHGGQVLSCTDYGTIVALALMDTHRSFQPILSSRSSTQRSSWFPPEFPLPPVAISLPYTVLRSTRGVSGFFDDLRELRHSSLVLHDSDNNNVRNSRQCMPRLASTCTSFNTYSAFGHLPVLGTSSKLNAIRVFASMRRVPLLTISHDARLSYSGRITF